MSATNRSLLVLDILKGIIALIFGNIGLPPLVLYAIGIVQPMHRIPMTTEKLGVSIFCLVIAIFAYHSTNSKIIKALVVIFIFVPLILMLLSFFAVMKVPLPF